MWRALIALLAAFRADRGGQIVIVFGLSSVAIFAGLGAGIDLATAYAARQRLSEVATLACQYSTRPSVAQTAASTYSGTNGFQTYLTAVNTFATASLATQHWSSVTPTDSSGTTTAYFKATAAAGGTSAAAAAPTNPTVEMYANIPTAFGRILNITAIPVHAKISCQTLAVTPQIVNPPTLLQEGFETACGYYCFTNPTGGSTTISTPTSAFPAVAGYVGYSGFKWYIIGYCLEIDNVGVINPTVPEGTHAAELDCDNGSGTKGNSSISSKIYLEAGQYELRYNYRSRVDYPNYDPTYICGSTASDVSFANDTSGYSPGLMANVARTNQINVYLDQNLAGTNGTVGSAPLHQTLDGQYLGGSNLIDSCVYTPTWIERSVRVKVTTPGNYWLSFAADGASDSYGGQIDNIRFCQELCAGSLQDNFPTGWLAANNGGVNKVLFEDTFETPIYLPGDYTWRNINGNLAFSMGTSGTASSGWPTQQQYGWATGPCNQVDYILQGAQQGSQYIGLDGHNVLPTCLSATHRAIGRPFILDPGYYYVNYHYISDETFYFNYSTYTVFPVHSGGIWPVQGLVQSNTRFIGPGHYANGDADIIGVFVASGQLISTPIGGGGPFAPVTSLPGVLGFGTSYLNTDGSTSIYPTQPTVAPDAVNYQNYNTAQVNPLIDTCGYSFYWVTRNIPIKITKPGIYWLTFSATSGTGNPTLTGSGSGGAIDDVSLTAVASPYLSGGIANATVIPVAGAQPDTSYAPSTYAGFTIVADPLTPPGADQ